MLTSVKYTSEPGVFAWPVPFAYADPSQVRARRVEASGLEHDLVQGRDYQLADNNLICILPPGEALIIYLDAVVAEVQAANNARALASLNAASRLAAPALATAAPAATPAYDGLAYSPEAPTQATQVDSASDTRLAALEADLAALKDEKAQALVAAREAEHDAQVRAVAATGTQALDAVASKGDEAVAQVRETASQALAQINSAAAQARSVTREAQEAAASAVARSAQAEASLADNLAAMEDRLTRLEARLAQSAQTSEARINQAALQGQSQIAAASRSARRDAQARAQLSGEAWPQVGYSQIQEPLSAGSILPLPEPLRYYPGRQALALFLNGLALVPGVDYAEVGQTLSASWRTLREILPGDLLLFVIAPTNAGQAAAISAKEAAQAVVQAQNHAASARTCVADCATHCGHTASHAAQALRHAEDAEQWLRHSEEQTRQAHRLRDAAAHEAWQASIVACRPGIAAVNDEAQLNRVLEGVYLINPHLLQTPTRFYGMWPVADLNAPILWDGVFFAGPAYEREPYVLPFPTPCPCLPPRAAPPVEVVEGNDWQPCNHIHHVPCNHNHRLPCGQRP